MVDLELTKLGSTNYQARVTRIVGGFSLPVDAEVIGNRIYVIEYGGNQKLWEVSFPPAPATLVLSNATVTADGRLQFILSGAIKEQEYQVQS